LNNKDIFDFDRKNQMWNSQLIRYSSTSRSCSATLDRWLLLRKTLLNQGFLVINLKSSLFWHCYGLHHNLVNRYRISGSQMTTCMFRLSLWQSGPFLWLITGILIRVTRRMPLVEQELHTLGEHISSPWFFTCFSGVCVFHVWNHISSCF
jgi:hypothetical protein